MLGASAVVGSFISPAPGNNDFTDVQLAATAASSPMPNELMAALVARPGLIPTNPDVSALGSGLAVSGSSVNQAIRAVAMQVENIAAAINAGIIEPGIGDFSNPDLDSAALALAAAVGGLASGTEIAFVVWDTFHIVFDSLVAGVGLTGTATAAGLFNALAGTLLDGLNALSASGVIPVPAAAAASTVLGLFSTVVTTGIEAIGTATALEANIDLALAFAVSTLGRGGVDALTALAGGDFPDLSPAALVALLNDILTPFPDLTNLPDLFPTLDLTALVTLLHNALPDLTNLPGDHFPTLDLTALVTLLHNALPDLTNLPGDHFPTLDLTALVTLLHNALPDLTGGQFPHEQCPDLTDHSDIGLAALVPQLKAHLSDVVDHSDMHLGAVLAHLGEKLPELPGHADGDLGGVLTYLRAKLPELPDHLDGGLAALMIHLRDKLPDLPNTADEDMGAILAHLRSKLPGLPDHPEDMLKGAQSDLGKSFGQNLVGEGSDAAPSAETDTLLADVTVEAQTTPKHAANDWPHPDVTSGPRHALSADSSVDGPDASKHLLPDWQQNEGSHAPRHALAADSSVDEPDAPKHALRDDPQNPAPQKHSRSTAEAASHTDNTPRSGSAGGTHTRDSASSRTGSNASSQHDKEGSPASNGNNGSR